MRLSVILALALAATAIGPAGAAPQGPAPGLVVGIALQYVPGDTDGPLPLEIEQGAHLYLTSVDPIGGAHTIVAYPDSYGRTLFESDQAGSGQIVEVPGVSSLTPGDYPFFCRNHFGMDGLLTVLPAH